MSGPILETVGVEIESIGLTRGEIAELIDKIGGGKYFPNVDRDASVEFYASQFIGEKITVNDQYGDVSKLKNSITKRLTYGYEIASVPMSIPLMEKAIWTFLPRLAQNGDFCNKRASLHVHVGFGFSLKILKRILKLGIKLDPLLFRMAGMGNTFRGEANYCTYCRPLSLGPVVSGEDGHLYRILNIESALNSTTIDELWKHFAITNTDGRESLNRYHLSRYFGVNLMSLLLHGTLEFRHLNQSLNPRLVVAMIKFIRGISELIFFAGNEIIDNLEQLSVFKTYNDSVYKTMLAYLIESMRDIDIEFPPTNKDVESLMNNIVNTPHHNLKEINVYTHINDFLLRSRYFSEVKFEKVNGKVIKPGQIDIHNIKKFSIID